MFARSNPPTTPTSGSLENRLHPCRLQLEVVVGGGVARREVGAGQGRSLRERRGQRALVLGVDEDSRLGAHELRWPPDPRRDDGAPRRHRFQGREAERLDEARLTEDVAGGDPGRNLVVTGPACELDPWATFEGWTERPVSDERERSLASLLECAGEAEDVLALRQGSEAEEGGALATPADLGARSLSVARGEPLEIDAAVDDLGLACRSWDRLHEALA